MWREDRLAAIGDGTRDLMVQIALAVDIDKGEVWICQLLFLLGLHDRQYVFGLNRFSSVLPSFEKMRGLPQATGS